MDATEFIGGYRLLRRLGTGGAGTVWLAENGAGEQLALKMLHPALAASDDARARLVRESRIVNSIAGHGVAHVVDIEVDDVQPFVVTELIEGPSLSEILQRGRLSPRDLAALARCLFNTLSSVHAAKVVHRDVKPSNIICAKHGPVLIDFGIAIGEDDVRLTSTGLVSGTAGFTSPEALANREVTAESDWWSFAATLLSAATGRPPFGPGQAGQVLARVSQGDPDVEGLPAAVAHSLVSALDPVVERRLSPLELVESLEAAAGRDVGTVVWLGIPHPIDTMPSGAAATQVMEAALSASEASAMSETSFIGGGNQSSETQQLSSTSPPLESDATVLQAQDDIPVTQLLTSETQPLSAATELLGGDLYTKALPAGDRYSGALTPGISAESGQIGIFGGSQPLRSSASPEGLQALQAPVGYEVSLPQSGIPGPSLAELQSVPQMQETPYVPASPKGAWLSGLIVVTSLAVVPIMSGVIGTMWILGALGVLSLLGSVFNGVSARRMRNGGAKTSDIFAAVVALPVHLIKVMALLVISMGIAGLGVYSLWLWFFNQAGAQLSHSGAISVGPWRSFQRPPWEWPYELVVSPESNLGSSVFLTDPLWLFVGIAVVWIFLALTWVMPTSMCLRKGVALSFHVILPVWWTRVLVCVGAVGVLGATWVIVASS